MTTVTAVPPPSHRRLFGLIGPKPDPIKVDGHLIKFRSEQQTAWSVIVGVLGACLVAGIYFAITQVHWYIHLGSFYWAGFWLKPHWDNMFSSPSWTLYRHGIRDLLEPALFIMAGKTLLASRKRWGKHVSLPRLIATPPLLAALALGLAIGGVWLLDFGLPNAWHWFFGTYTLTAPTVISHSSWQDILLGFAIGLVLHPLWAPVGATIQGYYVDKSVDRARGHAATGPQTANKTVPLWVRLPLAPPVLRERFSWWMANDTTTEDRGAANKALILAISIPVVLFTILGILAKFFIAKGIHIPYLAP